MIHKLQHNEQVLSAHFTVNGENLATACEDSRIYEWDIEIGKLKRSHEYHTKRVLRVRYSPTDPNILASSSDDRAVHIYEYGSLKHKLKSHRDGVCTINFNKEGNLLVSGISVVCERFCLMYCLKVHLIMLLLYGMLILVFNYILCWDIREQFIRLVLVL